MCFFSCVSDNMVTSQKVLYDRKFPPARRVSCRGILLMHQIERGLDSEGIDAV